MSYFHCPSTLTYEHDQHVVRKISVQIPQQHPHVHLLSPPLFPLVLPHVKRQHPVRRPHFLLWHLHLNKDPVRTCLLPGLQHAQHRSNRDPRRRVVVERWELHLKTKNTERSVTVLYSVTSVYCLRTYVVSALMLFIVVDVEVDAVGDGAVYAVH